MGHPGDYVQKVGRWRRLDLGEGWTHDAGVDIFNVTVVGGKVL